MKGKTWYSVSTTEIKRTDTPHVTDAVYEALEKNAKELFPKTWHIALMAMCWGFEVAASVYEKRRT